MSLIESILLGILQGFTEFLPVSSSGHLVLAQHFWEIKEPGISFEIIVHLGSLVAVLLYFHKTIFELIASALKIFSKEKSTEDINNLKVLAYLFIATFATAILGLAFKSKFEALYQLPLVVAIALAFNGFIVFISDKIPSGTLKDNNIGVKKSIFIGIGQAFAIIPGISRSGTTIVLSLFSKMKREHAARFSFLLSIPAILGAAVLDLRNFEAIESALMAKYFVGAIAAFVSGFIVIAFLIKLIQQRKLKYFAYYCWAISAVSLFFLLI